VSQVIGGNFVKRTGDLMLGDLCFVPGKRAVVSQNDDEKKIQGKLREIALRELKAEGKLPAD
jgi:hypothetical protein